MTTPAQVTPLPLEDYEAIEAAVMETQRGRWFLTEFARRNRNSDTELVVERLDRIERSIRRERAAPDIDRIRLDLADMAEAISRTKQEIAQMKVDADEGGRFAQASQELDAIVDQTEAATNDILLAAEGIQEVAWTLREAGAADDLCEKLDAHATEVYTACSFQDLTGQRTRKVVTVLRYLESRIHAMMDIWGLHEEEPPKAAEANSAFDPMDVRPDAHLLNGPQLQGKGVAQSDVDDLMWHNEAVELPEGETPLFETVTDDEPFATAAETAAAADAHETSAVDVFADADVFAAADVFASADVFATPVSAPSLPAAGRVAAGSAAAPLASASLANSSYGSGDVFTETVVVGNTVMTVETSAVAEVAVEATPRLEVVTAVDPVAELGPEGRLVTFG